MQHELLFEIGTEEIPAGYIRPALANMVKMMNAKLAELGLDHGEIKTAATPRRLTIGVSGLAAAQADRREEVTGPPKAAAFDADNKPTKAALGFAKSRGVTLDDVQIVATPKGEYLMVVVEKKGEKTQGLLPGVLADIINQLPFPKSMRWGAGTASFARPVQWILARFGGEVIPCRVNQVKSGLVTRGHRFMAPEEREVGDFNNYLETLRDAHVIADPEERRRAVIGEITVAAGQAGGRVMDDAELVDTVTNLVEEPHAVRGAFDEKFLALPREVLVTSMREHQKYFAVVDENGDLRPNFIAVNNTATRDQGLAVEGHQRVLRARLEDALFFFKEDQGRRLADRVAQLSGVVFQAGLGTMLEKTERITKLAGWLAQRTAPEKSAAAKRAALLAKTDLLTEMVNEFPSLQGAMGRAYALLDRESPEIAQAIAEHYMPVRAGTPLPESDEGAIVGLADRIDTIAGCFGIGKQPTGTTDPYGLRRLALGLLHIISNKGYSISLRELTARAIELYGAKCTEKSHSAQTAVLDFIRGRYLNDLIGRGIPISAVEAVTSVDFDDVIDCSRRIEALNAVRQEETFTILAGSFKRVRNIIKDHRSAAIDEKLLTDPAEKSLYKNFRETAAECEPLLKSRDYRHTMEIILRMKEPVDHFFDEVMVMAEDEKVRANRLSLLTAISRLFLRIGDFSKMS
ncbi:MAG: glycine--tRNA ligase subunit beta [Desulfobulbales bacterium]|nr:glycine--tRNA ligase subunit beta [Desulfobulbales bacterium]